MNNICPQFQDYFTLMDSRDQEKISRRYETFLEQIEKFISAMHYQESVFVNHTVLMNALLDYHSDVLRIKNFHNITRVNDIKIVAYESFWFLKRKPLQIKSAEKELAFVNEQFVLSFILDFISMSHDQPELILGNNNLDFFSDSLFYFLKFRPFDAQSLEMILVSFKAGEKFNELVKK